MSLSLAAGTPGIVSANTASAPSASHATGWVAPLVDASISVETVASAKTYNAATAKVTTTRAGDLLLAFVGSDSPRDRGNTSTVTGGGLSWTRLGQDNKQLGDAEIWSARATGTLTNAKVTAKQSIAGWDEALTVVAFANATGTGALVTSDAPTGAPTGTLTTTQPDSWAWAAGDDWLKSIARTPVAGQAIVHSATDAVGDTYWVQNTAGATANAGTPVTIADTAPTKDPYNLVLVEVLGARTVVPMVTGVTPPTGPTAGGNTVTVTGTGFTAATEVDFGSAKATTGLVVAADGSSLTVKAPPGAVGSVDVRVKTPAGESGTSSADQYTYTAMPATVYSGAQLVLSPGQAGPNAPHTAQTLKATLTDHTGKPMAGLQVAFAVSGANQAASSAATDAQGIAAFTYTGANAGTDSATATFAAGPDSTASQPSTITWAAPTAPVAPVSMDPVQGQFFAESAGASVFTAKPGDTAVFGQTFPDLAFNPLPGVIRNDHFAPSPTTHPLTDVTTDVTGNADGVLPAQGNGAQAGVGSLASFDAVFTTTLHVSQPGDLSYTVDSADGFLLGIGNGASRVNGDYVNPPASQQSAFDTYPLVAASDQPSGGSVIGHPVTIHFPAAGDYPLELDYFSRGGQQLSLVLRPSAAAASLPNTPPLNVYVGYQDTLRASNDFTISPLPWYGSPNTQFIGDTAAQGSGADAGGMRFDNVTNAPVTIDKVTVDIPLPGGGTPQHFDEWPAGIVVQPGQTLVLTENAGFDTFDTSDVDSGTCGVVQKLVPLINVTIGGVTSTYQDTGEVLNTGGYDLACLGNESQPWVRVGTHGPADPVVPSARSAAASGWDDAAKAFVLFGGGDGSGHFLGDTWVWQKGKWTSISPATAPGARAFAAGAYDASTQTFVLFGGYNMQTGAQYDDTWTFDGKTWTQQHPAHSPPVGSQASDKMAYDAADGTLVLVTATPLGSSSPDTWTWDGTDWTEHAGGTQPPARWQPALAYDPDTKAVVMFGGSAGYSGADLADTWSWSGGAWTQLSPAASPSGRATATMDYVPAVKGLVLFGGDHGDTDTWLFSGGTWSQIKTTANPPGRGYASSGYDPDDAAEIVAFGAQGGSLTSPLDDLWFLTGSGWSTTLPVTAGPAVAPADSLTISPGGDQSYSAGEARTFTVSAVGSNGQPLAGLPVQIAISGPNQATVTVTTGGDGTATFSDPGAVAGTDLISAVATVGGKTVASNAASVTWKSACGPAPALGASQPADGTVVRSPVPVTATITPPAGQSIASWSVTAAAGAPGSTPFTLASGTGTPPSPLATLDPTSLVNGQYDLTVSATASGCGVVTRTTALSVAGSMKLGDYQATYHELTVPVDGLPMTVDRVYDSRDRSAGDFGTGWHMALANFQVSTGRALGAGGWQQYATSCGILSCDYGYSSGGVSHAVTVTWPDGHQDVFDFTPTGTEFGGLAFVAPGYTARPGTVDTLASDGQLAFGDDGNLYDSTLAQVATSNVYDPTRYRLTTPDGTVYVLDTTTGLVSEKTAAGASITVDGTGVHGSNGESITVSRDSAHGNRVTQIAGPGDGVNGYDEHWTYGYNTAGELTDVTDPVTTVHYAYDPASGQLSKSTDANNQPLTTITYGPDGRIATVANGDEPPITVTSSAAARTQTVSDANGKLTTAEFFDTSGDLVEKDQAFAGKTLKTLYSYDSAGRLTSTTDPDGGVTSTKYDETAGPSNGEILARTDADGRTTSFGAYSRFGQPGEVVNPDGTVVEADTYDPTTGLTLTSGTPGLATTRNAYNPDGTLASSTDPAGHVTTYTYNGQGNQATKSDGAGETIRTVVDGTGRTVAQTDASGHETDYGYDGNGNVVSVTNAATHAVTKATYNGFTKPLTVTDADGKTTTYVYDGAGNVIKRTNPDGVVTTYTYDADGNLATEVTPTGTSHFAYDALGELVEADNANAEIDLAYDGAGHQTTQTTCASVPGQTACPAVSPTVTHGVDLAGAVTTTDTPAGHTAYAYDADGRLSIVTDPAGGLFVDGYDVAGRPISLLRPNGTVDTSAYDDAGQPTALTTSKSGTKIAAESTTPDPATGRVTATSDLAGTTSYAYNADGTLASAVHPAAAGLANEAYTYDAAGNRLTGTVAGKTSTYDLADHLLSDGANTYTWNGEGDLASKTNTATGVTTTDAWDADNRLVGTSLSSGGATAEKYDPFGRLVSDTDGTRTTTYLWDGETLVRRTSGTTVTTAVTAPASGDPAQPPVATLELTSGGAVTYPLTDLHGDPIGATTSAGALAGALIEYSAFGVPNAAGAGAATTFDGYHASATGLDAATARVYDPVTGRFLSQDPKVALNPYSYTGNDPIQNWDPTGAEELIEYSATLNPGIGCLADELRHKKAYSPAKSFACLGGFKVSPGYSDGQITVTFKFNSAFAGTAKILLQMNKLVQQTISPEQLKEAAETSDLSAAVCGFVGLFFGYEDSEE